MMEIPQKHLEIMHNALSTVDEDNQNLDQKWEEVTAEILALDGDCPAAEERPSAQNPKCYFINNPHQVTGMLNTSLMRYYSTENQAFECNENGYLDIFFSLHNLKFCVTVRSNYKNPRLHHLIVHDMKFYLREGIRPQGTINELVDWLWKKDKEADQLRAVWDRLIVEQEKKKKTHNLYRVLMERKLIQKLGTQANDCDVLECEKNSNYFTLIHHDSPLQMTLPADHPMLDHLLDHFVELVKV